MQRSSETGLADPAQPIDLATALGVGIEDAAQDGVLATVAVCSAPPHRLAYRAFLAERGLGERSVHEAHPQAVGFLVRNAGQPIGAAGLLPDSRLGLPIPEGFMPAVEGLRRAGRQLALLHPLVIPPTLSPRTAGLVLRTLFRLCVLTARRLDGRTDLLVYCEPHHARFFAQVLLFTIEAEAPGQILLRLDLDLCPGEWLRLYGDGAWSPYTLYARPSQQATRIVEWLRRQRQPPGLGEVVSGWIAARDGTPPAGQAELRALQRLYPGLAEHLAAHGLDALTAGPPLQPRSPADVTGPRTRLAGQHRTPTAQIQLNRNLNRLPRGAP